MKEYFEASRWLSAAKLLSLDVISAIYGELGLSTRYQHSLLGLLRDALVGAFQPAHAPLDAGSPAQVVAAYQDNITPCLKGLNAAFGRGAVEGLRFWVEYTYETDGNPWELYHVHLTDWAQRVRRDSVDPMSLHSDAVEIADALRRAVAVKDVTIWMRSECANALSKWDRTLFEREGVSEFSANEDVYLPFLDAAVLAVRMHRFQSFLTSLRSQLPPDDVCAIEAAVRSSAGEGSLFVPLSGLPVAPG